MLNKSRRDRGQSIVELALVLPVLLLMVLGALDFGRLFVGWVTLNNAARVGASYAALHPEAWDTPGSAVRRAAYDVLVTDARADAEVAMDGCAAEPVPAPQFPSGKDVGDFASVGLVCTFTPLTPLIGDLFASTGNSLGVSARSVFPVRSGVIDGPAITPAPICLSSFTWEVVDPVDDPLTVTFTETTPGTQAAFLWDFGDATASTAQNPPPHQYPSAGTRTVTLRASGCTPFSDPNVTVTNTPPEPGTDPSPIGCTVPSFIGKKKNDSPDLWLDAGFTESITYDPDKNGNWVIQAQSLVGGFSQPCNVAITLGPDPLEGPAP